MLFRSLLVALVFFAESVPGLRRQVMVVTSTDELEEPRVLEIFDFAAHRWRAVEKSDRTVSPADFQAQRAKSMRRPGTARLVENHAVLQYELRNGLGMELATYPGDIEGAATVEYGDTFCLVGGYELHRLRNEISCWNPLERKLQQKQKRENGVADHGGWVALPSMKRARFHPGAVVMDGKLFVAGGYDSDNHTYLSNVEVFDDVSQKWYRIADMNTPRAGLQLAAARGKIYAIGGWKDRKFLDVVEEYDTIRNSWKVVAPMASPRAKFGAVTRRNMIYVVGGKRGFRAKDQLRAVEVYDPERNKWIQSEPSMSIVHGSARATIVNAS
jgi:hypothetical protein